MNIVNSNNKLLKLFISLLVFGEHGEPIEIEKFMRQSLKQFPHVYSVLLKQMVATLSKIPLVRCRTSIRTYIHT